MGELSSVVLVLKQLSFPNRRQAIQLRSVCTAIKLYTSWKCLEMLVPKRQCTQAWTQVFISQAFPSLYMGNAQALKLLETANFIAVLGHLQGRRQPLKSGGGGSGSS